VAVDGDPAPGRAGTSFEGRIAEVRSQPLGRLVEHMLTASDNDLAEALARQVAVARGEPASFDGAGRAVAAVLREAGVPVDGARFADGSGLDRADAVPGRTLTALLALASSPGRPALRPVLTGLPVAGFTGTLTGRYAAAGEPAVRGAAGVVRAKTGTLTGVNTLAGTAVDADGRLLAFAFAARGTTVPDRATAALDRLAAAVAGCGCR
jgi:D-alanyl-D-alanine carboxypeptidase/D-alanyl-D-alanine-endopeptidase (penicillin-binding protein 4)